MQVASSFIQQLFANTQFDILLQSKIQSILQLNPQAEPENRTYPNKLSQQLAQGTQLQKYIQPKISIHSLIEEIGSTLMQTVKCTVDQQCNEIFSSYSSILTEITQLKSKFQDMQLSISQISLKKQSSQNPLDYDNPFNEDLNQFRIQKDLSQIQQKISQMSFMNNSITQQDLYKINEEDINLKIKTSVENEIQMTQKQLQKKLQQMNKTMQNLFELIHVLQSSIQTNSNQMNKSMASNKNKKTLGSIFSLK